jgi:hypothetical protein
MNMTYLLNAKDKEQRNNWELLWKRWPQREVFAHPGYVELFCRENDEPICFVFEQKNGAVLFPAVMRPLKNEIWAKELESYYDIISPYGYGGAFFWGDIEEKVFWENFYNWAISSNIICLFCRLSLFNENQLEFKGEKEFRSLNIVVDLSKSIEQIWLNYEHKVRKNVKRARSVGISIEIDNSGRYLEAFLDVYYSTMKRRNAKEIYYFPKEFFIRLLNNLSGNAIFFHAKKNDTIISSELVLVSEERIYSFLGGTKEEAFEYRPNDYLKHSIIEWGIIQNKREFILGGGYEKNDGIYKYKKSFAPDGEVPFFIGKVIFNREVYEKCVSLRRKYELEHGHNWEPNPNFFPEYRS